MDRGPCSPQSHPSQIRLRVFEAKQHSRTIGVVYRSGSCVGKRRVSCDDGPFLTSSSPNHPKGETHQRQRRAMAPAFGPVEAKGLLPCFMDSANKAG